MLVDPKQVELNHYESIPHLLTPVITSPRMAANALQNLVKEMEQRYGTMSLARTRTLPELNRAREKRGEPPLPYILCVIDELADLMMVAPADVEDSIIRLAQKARAVGIHLVLATQSPRVDVITGMIKANVPSRIAFAVSSQTDSRVILDQNGAESLLGQGDMLFSPVGSSQAPADPGRLHRRGADRRADRRLAPPGRARVPRGAARGGRVRATTGVGEDAEFHPDEDPLLEEAIALVAQMGTASTSMLQRRLRLGYTRAGRLIDMLERRGIISGYEGSKPRQVLITEADVPRILSHLAEAEGGASQPVRVPDDEPPLASPEPAQMPATSAGDSVLSGTFDAGVASVAFVAMADIGSTLREARMRAPDRHHRGRDADEDPRQVPARDRERGVGPAPRAGLRQELPAHLRRLTSGSTAGCSSTSTSAAYERPSDHEHAADRRRCSRERERAAAGPLLPSWAIDRRRAGRRSWSRCTSSATLGTTTTRRRPPAGANTTAASPASTPCTTPAAARPPPAKPTTVKLQLVPTGTVYVCLVDGTGKKLIPGQIFSRGPDDPDRDSPQAAAHARQRLGPDEGQRQVSVQVAPSRDVDRLPAAAERRRTPLPRRRSSRRCT